MNYIKLECIESAGLTVRSYPRTVVERYFLTRQQQPDRLGGVAFWSGRGDPLVEPVTLAQAQTTEAFAREAPTCSKMTLN